MAQRRNTAPSLKCSVPLPESDNPGVLLEEAAPNLHESVVSPHSQSRFPAQATAETPSAARRQPQGAYSVSYCAFYSRRPFCEPTLPIAVNCSRVPEEQVRHLLLAFSLSLPLFSLVNSTSLPLSLSRARGPSPTLHCASMTNRAKRKLNRRRRSGGVGDGRAAWAELALVYAPNNNSSPGPHPSFCSKPLHNPSLVDGIHLILHAPLLLTFSSSKPKASRQCADQVYSA